jgi:hypothetical protein
MRDFGPIARIFVRYVAGLAFGASAAEAIINDPDIMNYLAIGLSIAFGVGTEYVYSKARARGWAT